VSEEGALLPRKVDVRLPGNGISNGLGARPVHLVITMMSGFGPVGCQQRSLPLRSSRARDCQLNVNVNLQEAQRNVRHVDALCPLSNFRVWGLGLRVQGVGRFGQPGLYLVNLPEAWPESAWKVCSSRACTYDYEVFEKVMKFSLGKDKRLDALCPQSNEDGTYKTVRTTIWS